MKKILSVFMLVAFLAGSVAAEALKVSNAAKSRFYFRQTASQTQDNQKATKKDGTLDKRFKENKPVKPVVIPLKKDGTPDNRHKINKNKMAPVTP